jgi:hypothetical protein
MVWGLLAALGGLAFLLQGQQQAGDENLAAIEGHAVNAASGEPIHKAVVRLSLRGANRVAAIIGSTDAGGKFHFKGVAPGEYDLSAERNGFLSASYDSVLSVKAGDDFKDITLKLLPAAIISGRVIDEDGDPVPGAEVTLLYRENFLGQNKIQRRAPRSTDYRGEFYIDGLEPGRYFVSADHNRDSQPSNEDRVVDSRGDTVLSRYALTYYPNVLLINDASQVEVVSGQEAGGIEIRLRRSKTYRIAGRIVGFEHVPAAGLDLIAYQPRTGESYAAKLSANGDFSVQCLLPGGYQLSLVEPGKGTVGTTQVEITDADRTEVTINPHLPSRVKLRIVVEGREPTPLPVLIGFLRKTPVDTSTSCILEDGICAFRDIEPGTYILGIRGPAHSYIKMVRAGSRTFSRRAIEVPEGDLALEVVLSDVTGQIEGEVLADGEGTRGDKTEQRWSSTEVALVPVTAPDELFDIPHTTSLDQYGHFSFHDVQPGKYRLYAEEQIGIYRWSNPNFVREMESMGTEVEVREKDELRLQLNQIPKIETARILDKLSLQ